eukprot:scaffold5946_cov114-Isochrysis_galbana.AAC.12
MHWHWAGGGEYFLRFHMFNISCFFLLAFPILLYGLPEKGRRAPRGDGPTAPSWTIDPPPDSIHNARGVPMFDRSLSLRHLRSWRPRALSGPCPCCSPDGRTWTQDSGLSPTTTILPTLLPAGALVLLSRERNATTRRTCEAPKSRRRRLYRRHPPRRRRPFGGFTVVTKSSRPSSRRRRPSASDIGCAHAYAPP